MSIAFKPTTKDKRAIRNIIVDEWLDENQVRDMPDKVLSHMVEYCWGRFTDNIKYAVAAQYWKGPHKPDSDHQRIIVGYFKTIKQATNAAKQFHWNSRLLQNRQTSRKRGQTIPLEHPATTTMENMDTPSPQRHRVRVFHPTKNFARRARR